MPKRGQKKPRKVVGDPHDPEGLVVWMKRYLTALQVKNYSPRTVQNREVYLEFFIEWCEARSISRPQEVTKPILERYQRHLFHLRKKNGKPLSFRAQHCRLVPVRGYFKWLTRQNVILSNPASELELPQLERRLPRAVLTAEEAEAVIKQPSVLEPLGIRDRAILEVLYSTGIRRMEVLNLSVYDLDEERGTLMVRRGKRMKDRMVPIAERAAAWVQRWVQEARPQFVMPPDDGRLFLGVGGDDLTPNRLTQLVRNYVKQSEVGKKGACHLFRHTMATLMLENGADIRFIQEMLGHAELSTTQIYTQVSIRKLKAVHELTHPASRKNDADREPAEEPATAMQRDGDVARAAAARDTELPATEPQDPTPAVGEPRDPELAAAEPGDPRGTLLAQLAAEDDEESECVPD